MTPPIVNTKTKPIAHNIGVLNSIVPPHMVAIHEKILTPVSTAITMLDRAKKAWALLDMPTVYKPRPQSR